MGILDSLKSFFGISRNDERYHEPCQAEKRFTDFTVVPRLHPRYNNELPEEEEERFGINIYSSPLEIAKYFEQQMDSMMKNMQVFSGMGHIDDFFNNTLFNDPDIKVLEPPQSDEKNSSGSLRDQFLKPGYKQKDVFEKKSDDDIDGRINMNDVGEIFERSDSKVVPYTERPKFHFYSQSVTSKTVRRPDGMIETHRTVRDKDGNEQTTITRKFGDKEYTIITKVDKNGRKEIDENMVNMDENDKDKLGPFKGPGTSDGFPKGWSDFERFFK